MCRVLLALDLVRSPVLGIGVLAIAATDIAVAVVSAGLLVFFVLGTVRAWKRYNSGAV